MKNQYFGDNRDLFKYDLLSEILTKGRTIRRCTFIPMLTKDDPSGHGSKIDRSKARAGFKNNKLVRFLDKCIEKDDRDIRNIVKYFKGNLGHTEFTVYKAREYFPHGDRRAYFHGIGDKLLHNALIFIDPDNGLEVERPNEKHLLHCEVKELYGRMDADSILMIYQHFPREDHIKYLKRRSDELKKITGDPSMYISDNEIVFFFVAKNAHVKCNLKRILLDYQRYYSGLLARVSS